MGTGQHQDSAQSLPLGLDALPGPRPIPHAVDTGDGAQCSLSELVWAWKESLVLVLLHGFGLSSPLRPCYCWKAQQHCQARHWGGLGPCLQRGFIEMLRVRILGPHPAPSLGPGSVGRWLSLWVLWAEVLARESEAPDGVADRGLLCSKGGPPMPVN